MKTWEYLKITQHRTDSANTAFYLCDFQQFLNPQEALMTRETLVPKPATVEWHWSRDGKHTSQERVQLRVKDNLKFK